MVRITQHGFQPQAVATPDLDLGCPRALFNPDVKVCMPMIRANMIHILLYKIYEYNRQQVKEIQAGTNTSAYEIFSYLACDMRDIQVGIQYMAGV